MEELVTPITSINGPVCFYKFTTTNVNMWSSFNVDHIRMPVFYFIGDVHYSKENGCLDNCIQIDRRTNVVTSSLNSECIDLDTALHTWLLFNNIAGITTDYFLEVPSQTLQHSTKSREDESDLQRGWLDSTTRLVRSCLLDNKNCLYGPNSRVHYTDIRQGRGDEYLSEVFSSAVLNKSSNATYQSLEEIYKYLSDNFDRIWQAYTEPESLHILLEMYQEIGKLATTSPIRHLRLALGSAYFDTSKTKTLVKSNGITKSIRMYKAAWQLYKLSSRDVKGNDLANKLRAFVADNLKLLKTELEVNITKLAEQTSVSGYLIKLERVNNAFINCGVLLMDIYTLSRALYYNNNVCIFHAGANHTRNYIVFARDYLGYREVFGVDNVLEHIDEQTGTLSEIGREIVDRCISSEELPLHLNFREMLERL